MNNGRLITDLMKSVERAMAKLPCGDRQGPTVEVRTEIPLPVEAVPAALLYQANYCERSLGQGVGRAIEVM